MMGDMMVEILAGVSLVVHQEALIAEPEILDQDSVAWERLHLGRLTTSTRQNHAFNSRVQPKRDAMSDAVLRSFPHIAVVRSANAKPPFRAYDAESSADLRLRANRGAPCRRRSARRASD